jgi:hypothetical protein
LARYAYCSIFFFIYKMWNHSVVTFIFSEAALKYFAVYCVYVGETIYVRVYVTFPLYTKYKLAFLLMMNCSNIVLQCVWLL